MLKNEVFREYKGEKVDFKRLNELFKKGTEKQKDRLLAIKSRLNSMRYARQNREFKSLFGFNMPFDGFIYFMTSRKHLDVIALDKRLCTPNGISTKDFIAKKYGEKASDFVQSLI